MGKRKKAAKIKPEEHQVEKPAPANDDLVEQMLAEMQVEFVDASSDHSTVAHVSPGSPNEEKSASSGGKKRNRRKEKLQQRDEERAKAIQEAEAEAQSVPDKRRIEIEALAKVEAENGLEEFHVEPDGHCLFHSIADQLEQRYGTKESASSLRTKAAQTIRENGEHFAPYLLDEVTGEVRNAEDYTKELEGTAMWGGDLEIIALSQAFKCPIRIFFGFQPPMTINAGFEGEPLNISYHRDMYGLGAHYNSLRDVKETE